MLYQRTISVTRGYRYSDLFLHLPLSPKEFCWLAGLNSDQYASLVHDWNVQDSMPRMPTSNRMKQKI